MMKGKKTNRCIQSMLVCIILLLFCLISPTEQVQAETTRQLGTSMITDPMKPNKNTTVWTGNYVYFGRYNGQLIKYRVLDACTTDYSADGKTKTMLLDCDRILYSTMFDQDKVANVSGKYANDWSISDIKTSLNGADFLNKDGVLSSAERDAIAESTISSHALTTDAATGKAVSEQNQEVYQNYVALNGDRVFLLDVEDVCNEAYGYTRGIWWDILGDYYYGRSTRGKKDLSNLEATYWLRSAQDKINAGSISDSAIVGQWRVNYTELGVSPAFNLNLASVLFTSVVNETNSNGGKSYKLSLIDNDITMEARGVTKNGNTVTIPYTLSGSNSANATQISALVLDKKYTAGNTNGANILDYQVLTNYVTAGSVTYTLPSSLSGKQEGSDYYIYVLAEDINGDRINDYSSEPVQIHLWEAPAVKAMHFGTQGIVGPAVPNHPRDAWKGCYVYFGNYNGSPVKYRVLDADTTYYSADKKTQTMLLDCDSVLYSAAFDGESPYSNTWKGSPIYNNLNGADFLEKSGVFTSVEKNAIAESTVGKHALTTNSETGVNVTSGVQTSFENYIALTGEKIFFLDAEDVGNGAYGYTLKSHDVKTENRIKSGAAATWWLRSANGNGSRVGDISSVGSIYSDLASHTGIGVSPALNLKLSSVFFVSESTVGKTSALTSESTKIGTTTNTGWKLTLKDSGKSVTLTEGKNVTKSSDGTITVPYTYTDSAVAALDRVNQISVMITDEAYGSGNAEILYYGALDHIKNAAGEDSTVAESTVGSGTFLLPGSLTGTRGEDYHIYLLAEHVSEGNGTDYAGEPLEIVSILNAVDRVEMSGIEVPTPEKPFISSMSIASTGTSGTATFVWKKNGNTVTGNAEWKTTYKVYVKLTPADGYTFMDATGQIAKITIDGKQGASGAVTWNADGTLTIYWGECTTASRKINSVSAPQAPKQFAVDYAAENVLSSKELGTTAKGTLQGTTQPNTANMKVHWSIVDAEGNAVTYNAAPAAYNTFKWVIKESEYTQYDANGVVMEGTVTIQNKRCVPAVTVLPTVAERTYHPTKVLVNSDIKGGAVKDQTGTVVAGTWSWKKQNVVPSVDKKEYEVIFVPSNTKYYEPITKTITVKVKKATPVIVTNPKASKIIIGKKLRSSVLSGGKVQLGTVKVAGTFKWKDATVKPALKDNGVTKYVVVFTPSDTVNYNTVHTKLKVVLNPPAKGTKDVSDNGKATYKITKSDLKNGTVSYVASVNKKATVVSVPATVKIDGVTYKVTAIAANAFKNNTKIKKVIIGKNVKTIGANAFYKCTKLKTVKFGSNVTTIGNKAFYKCTALTKISLPNKVKTVGKYAFYGCKKVTYITIGKNVTKIGAKAFYGCSKVKTLTVKSMKLTAKKIGSKAFSKTPKRMKVKLPKKKFNAYKLFLTKQGVDKNAKFRKF